MTTPDLQRIQVRVPARPGAPPPVHDVVRALHRFIQRGALDEVLVDVADYAHVGDGPGTLLVAHAAQYSFGVRDGRFGVLYARKRDATGTLSERFADAVARAHRAATLLAADLAGGFAVDGGELLVQVADRLRAPNDDAALARLEPAIRDALAGHWNAPFTLAREGDPRGPLTVRARLGS